MKNYHLFLSLITLLLFSAISCTNSESDTKTSKNFTISDFTSLNLQIIGEVIYEQSDSYYLSASGNSKLIEALEISDGKGELSIELKNKRKFSGNKQSLIIRVGSPHLQSINFEGVGTLHLKNYFEGDQLNITNKGVGEIIIDDCNVDIFDLTSKSVGSIEIKGTANEASIQSEGVGNIDCSEFLSKRTKVINKGAGNLSAYAQESINIFIAGIGNVKYYGNPAEVITDISGIGKVKGMDR